jgi:hypothetical protein
MTLAADRLEALIVARAGMLAQPVGLGDLLQPLARFAPPELTPDAWLARLAEVAGELGARGVLDAGHRLRDPDELVRRLGRVTARSWPALADRVLPALALGIAADDGKHQGLLAGRDAWAAAIVGRALALWHGGAPPSLAAVCDALAWRELELPGKPKRCPPEIRAKFVQRVLRSDAGPPERLVRVLAAREVGAPRPELRALRDALVRGWLAGRSLGEVRASVAERPAPGEPRPEPPPEPASAPPDAAASGTRAPGDHPPPFASDVWDAAGAVPPDGRFGDRKVFISAVWHELRRSPRWSAVTLDELKARLVAAHRAGELTLARADLVAAMDPALVAASEITADGASFHFLVKEPAP